MHLRASSRDIQSENDPPRRPAVSEMTEDGVSIGDGRIESAAVTDRSGDRAGAFGADAQGAACIESGDGTASCANGMNFKHGHGDWETRDDCFTSGAQVRR